MKHRHRALSPRNVLIVGDDSFNRRSTAEQLRTAGFRVLLASTIAQAGDQLALRSVSIVIADLSAMCGSGLVFIDEVRSLHYDVKLIAISANPRLRILAKCMGVKAVLEKPLRPEHLTKAVTRLLDQQPSLRMALLP